MAAATFCGSIGRTVLREPAVSQPLRVLQVEDSESDAAIVVRALREAGYEVEGR
jgi:PleD family two-component response regulator